MGKITWPFHSIPLRGLHVATGKIHVPFYVPCTSLPTAKWGKSKIPRKWVPSERGRNQLNYKVGQRLPREPWPRNPVEYYGNSRRLRLQIALQTCSNVEVLRYSNKSLGGFMDAVTRMRAKLGIRRQQPELVRPSEATPNHVLSLSNLDDQISLRFHVPLLHFYAPNATRDGAHDPRNVIRHGLSKVLVPYYPFAGRLRQADDGKLCVDCTGQGLVFIAAEADARLTDFGKIRPPFPGWQELLHIPPGCNAVTEAPVLVIQVTLLGCGGFVLGTWFNHVMCDGTGVVQFLNTLGQICRDGQLASVNVDPPVWRRRTLLPPRNPARMDSSAFLQAFGGPGSSDPGTPADKGEDMCEECVVFTSRDIALLQRCFAGATTFELLSACLWRTRTRALYASSSSLDETVRLVFPVNVRPLFRGPPVQSGYYGNVIAWACAAATAGDLCKASLGKVARWIRRAKDDIDEEYVRSSIDAPELLGRAPSGLKGTYLLSDIRKLGFGDVDFGWGKAVYGGAAAASRAPMLGPATWLNIGADGAVVGAMHLPRHCMPLFLQEFSTTIAPTVSLPLN